MAAAPESGVSHGTRTLLAGAESRARPVGGRQRLPARQPDRDCAHLGTDTGILGCVAQPVARCGEPSVRLVGASMRTARSNVLAWAAGSPKVFHRCNEGLHVALVVVEM